MQWYYVKDDEKKGPFEEPMFRQLIASGAIQGSTLVWNSKMTEWKPYSEVPDSLSDMQNSISTGSYQACSLCGDTKLKSELISFENSFVCTECKPQFVQQIKEDAEISGTAVMRYAGFWIRVASVFIDGFIISFITVPLSVVGSLLVQLPMAQSATPESFAGGIAMMLPLQLLQMAIPAIYMIVMNGKYGATLGKKILGLRIVMEDGSKMSFGCAVGRYFAYLLSGLIIYIGYIMAGFDEQKRSLHDQICRTRVIYDRK